MNDVDPDLGRRISERLESQYQATLKRDGPDQAYAATYERAVDLVARALKLSPEKTKFASRDLLQEIMNTITG